MPKRVCITATPLVASLVLALAACGDDAATEEPGDAPEQPGERLYDAAGPARPIDAGMPLDVSSADAAAPHADASDDHAHDAGALHPAFERLLVADAVEPIVRVVDVEPSGVHAAYTLEGVARVYTGSSGAYGYAVQGEADVVSIVSSGLHLEDHGDHVHEEREAAALLGHRLEGDYPVHFVAHDGLVALFFDNLGRAHVLDESTLGDATPSVRTVDTGMPHHGVALAFHDHILLTRPELLAGATRATPTGIAVHDASGAPTGQVFGGCTGVHGEATRGTQAAFGCKEGVLLVEAGTPTFRAKLIPNPPSVSEPAPRVGTLAAHPALPHFVANYGSDALASVDDTTLTPHPAPEPYVQFDIDPTGEHIVLLTRDGSLRLLDARTFARGPLFAVTSPITDDSGHGARHPQFAFGEHTLYVSDPSRAQVHAVDLEAHTVLHSIAVPGTPAKLTVLRPTDAHAH